MHMLSKLHRTALLTLAVGGLLGFEASAQNSPLLLPGQVLPGAGTINAVGEFAMNSQGSWVAVVRTDAAPAPGKALLVRDGTPLLTPFGTQFEPWFSTHEAYLDIDEAGNVAWIGNDPATGQWVLMLGQTEVLRQGTLADVDGNGSSNPILGIRVLVLPDDGSGALYAVLREEPATQEALVRLRRDSQGVLQVSTVVTKGTVLPGGQVVFEYASQLAARYRYELDSNVAGDLVFAVEAAGVYRYRAASGKLSPVLVDGSQSPFFGKTWGTERRVGRSLTDSGSAFAWATLEAAGESAITAIARDQQLLLSDEQQFEGPSGAELRRIEDLCPIRVSKDGQALWIGLVDSQAKGTYRALYRDRKMIVAEGITRIQGQRLKSFFSGGASYDLDADGSTVLVRAQLEDGRTGLFAIEPEATFRTLPGCTPKLAQLGQLDPTQWAVGPFTTPWSLAADNYGIPMAGRQDSSAVALLLLSPAGFDTCGPLLPGLGEVLVDLGSGELRVLPSGLGGPLAVFPISIDLGYDLGLQGLPVYAQGLWYSPLNPVEPVRFSNGIKFTLGI
jgi:hypothetical protein